MQHSRGETREQQCGRAGWRGAVSSASAARLAAVWAERDAEIDARLGGPLTMAYKFQCKHCGSRFSLAQELEAHEGACGQVGAKKGEGPTTKAGEPRPCKYCGKLFANFGEYGAHRWSAHREEVLADLARSREQRKADERKIDAAIKGNGRQRPGGSRSIRPNGTAPIQEATCLTCGGMLPPRTAHLIEELRAAGIPELQAFQAALIASKMLGGGAVAG